MKEVPLIPPKDWKQFNRVPEIIKQSYSTPRALCWTLSLNAFEDGTEFRVDGMSFRLLRIVDPEGGEYGWSVVKLSKS